MRLYRKLLVIFSLIAIFGCKNYKNSIIDSPKDSPHHTDKNYVSSSEISSTKNQIEELSKEEKVINYIKNNHQLPDYYITKKEAKRLGWIANEGNLCEVLPNRIIGGDIFSNRQKKLPSSENRIYYEADLNYHCGRRGKDRVIFSNDGLIFVTYDHYSTFNRK